MAKKKKDDAVLLPLRHPNLDFFICDITDAAPKGDVGSMEHPMFALRAGDHAARRYEHNGTRVEIFPGFHGLATIHDKDVLIYCTSQLTEALNQGREPNRTVRATAHDILVSTNRETSGDGYRRLREALRRLSSTRIETNIRTNGTPKFHAFGFIDDYEVVEKSPTDGRMIALTITLSQWLYDAIVGREILTLSRDYFRLRKPLERRLYEIARKHCGVQPSWKCSLAILHKKSGTTTELREFRSVVREVVKHQHLPDYDVLYDSAEASGLESVTFRLRPLEERTRTALAQEEAIVDTADAERRWRAAWEAEHPDRPWPGIAAAARALRSDSE